MFISVYLYIIFLISFNSLYSFLLITLFLTVTYNYLFHIIIYSTSSIYRQAIVCWEKQFEKYRSDSILNYRILLS